MNSSGSKEGELVTAVLMYAIRCLAEGDQPALTAMNFGPVEVEALKELQLTDIYRAGILQSHCLSISLDRGLYRPLLDQLGRRRETEQLQHALIRADAPQDMMQVLFGVGSREYTRLRRLFSVDPSVGRPPEPDEEISEELWKSWSKLIDDRPSGRLSPTDYLALHNQSGLSARAVWTLTQRWAEFGNLNN